MLKNDITIKNKEFDKIESKYRSDSMTAKPWELQTFATGKSTPAPVSVILVCPKIPGNCGAVCRTCAATGAALRLVGPIGFKLDDTKIKRAGLNFWSHVCVDIDYDWHAFMSWYEDQPQPKRLIAFTAKSSEHVRTTGIMDFWTQDRFQKGDILLFGAEDVGLPGEAIDAANASGGCVRIPMLDERVNCMNLSVCVAVGLFEALRQIG